jgi:hypothetical protein
VSVTIYRQGNVADYIGPSPVEGARGSGLAMISETRTVDLPAGPAIIRFRGVADTMVAQTAQVEGLPSDVIERNFDYDLLSPGSLVEKSIGETVDVVRTNRKTGRSTSEKAVIRSGPNGVVLDFGAGRFEALGCSGLPERLVFAHAPANLSDAGVLSVHTNAPTAGRYVVKLSYLASALNWSANYVARLDPHSSTLTLTGSITLANFGAVGFTDAPTDLVAARLARDYGQDQPLDPNLTPLEERCWPIAQFAPRPIQPRVAKAPPLDGNSEVSEVVVTGSRIVVQKLADYKLYAAPQPTTIAARQVKQIQFLEQPRVKYQHLYVATVDVFSDQFGGSDDKADDKTAPTSTLRFKNNASDGLGLPLPEGTLSVLAPDEHGGIVFVGDGHVRDTPVADLFDLDLGDAIDLDVDRRIVAMRKKPDGSQEIDLEITIDNRKAAAVTVEVAHTDSHDDLTVARESARHTTDRGLPVWFLNLAPGEHRVLRYTVRYPD